MNPIVIKLGGAAGVDAEAVCADVAALVAEGWPLVLVHGTSAAADALAAHVGLPVRHITSPSGHVSRYTDPEMLELFVAAAAGQVNKSLTAGVQRLGCNAAGLSGVDGRLLVARRKDAVRAVEGGVHTSSGTITPGRSRQPTATCCGCCWAPATRRSSRRWR